MGKFPDDLNYNYAVQLKKEILSLFSSGGDIFLDLKNVERASLACVQVLTAGKQRADKDNIEFRLDPSDAFKGIAKDLGLDQILGTEGTS